ncbi:kinase-like protein [Trametes sanguinea]|nr:kinase-like protein [Trametes sanguinea]
MGVDTNDLHPAHIFNPPQEEIDRIVPRLVWPQGKLHVLGLEVHGQNAIFDIGDGRVVKTGPTASVDEAKTMLFIRAHTTIPVPQVYMVFKHDGRVHIVMERIDGVALRESHVYNADGSIDPENALTSKEGLRSVMLQLQQIIDELQNLGRRFPQDEPQLGSWTSRAYRNSYFVEDLPAIPFRTLSEFHGYWAKRLEGRFQGSGVAVAQPLIEKLRQLRDDPSQKEPCVPVLSHGDLAPRNILVQGDRIVAIVDWETFAWYPAFWEVMGVKNELMLKALVEVQKDVFGETTVEVKLYLGVMSCLTAWYLN